DPAFLPHIPAPPPVPPAPPAPPKLMPQVAENLGPPLFDDQGNFITSSLVDDGYDIWRIECRGPLDPAVLANYTPTIEQQPDPNDITKTRPIHVANHAVLWSAPYLGDDWTGRGTLLDPDTEAQLQDYVNAGGRLLITGRDVAW